MALWIMVYTWSVSYGMMLICAGSIPVNKKPKADRASLRTKSVLMICHALNWQEKLMGSVSIRLSSIRRRSNVICGLSMSYGKNMAKPTRHYYSAPTLAVRPWIFCAITRQDFRLSSCSAMPSNTRVCAIAKRPPKQS